LIVCDPIISVDNHPVERLDPSVFNV